MKFNLLILALMNKKQVIPILFPLKRQQIHRLHQLCIFANDEQERLGGKKVFTTLIAINVKTQYPPLNCGNTHCLGSTTLYTISCQNPFCQTVACIVALYNKAKIQLYYGREGSIKQ